MRSVTKAQPLPSGFAVVWMAFAASAAIVSLSPQASGYIGKPPRGPSDVLLYQSVIARVRSGETYYQAAAAELPARGYPTQSVFNWRLPLPAALLGRLPDPRMGKIALVALAVGVMWLGCATLLAEQGALAVSTGGLALVGALLACALGDLYVMPELASGVLLCLSVLLVGRHRGASVAAGLGALALRELALPYVLVSLVAAIFERRFREAAAWTLGLAAWGGWLAWHAAQVAAHRPLDGIAHDESWVQFGGAGFLVSLAQMNAFLLNPPQVAAAVYLAVAMLGAAVWPTPVGRRLGLTLAVYVVAFAIVGHEFNQYWGWMLQPLLALALGAGVASLHRGLAWGVPVQQAQARFA